MTKHEPQWLASFRKTHCTSNEEEEMSVTSNTAYRLVNLSFEDKSTREKETATKVDTKTVEAVIEDSAAHSRQSELYNSTITADSSTGIITESSIAYETNTLIPNSIRWSTGGQSNCHRVWMRPNSAYSQCRVQSAAICDSMNTIDFRGDCGNEAVNVCSFYDNVAYQQLQLEQVVNQADERIVIKDNCAEYVTSVNHHDEIELELNDDFVSTDGECKDLATKSDETVVQGFDEKSCSNGTETIT